MFLHYKDVKRMGASVQNDIKPAARAYTHIFWYGLSFAMKQNYNVHEDTNLAARAYAQMLWYA